MKGLKAVIAVLMLAVWMPASSHALLEWAEVIHEDEHHPGAHTHHDQDHDAADGLCAISSTHSAVVHSGPSSQVAYRLALFIAVDAAVDKSHTVCESTSGTSPPHFHGWQFIHRAALPVRAPSCLG